ncbi:LuxR C-terminal-related transcriptional regulator [Thaumasiovibrio subtropicus]|uniref:LuxR C-terminal-related transcriptional regulator n=1 Tax=Thaumasiovibrio subtropicus TaxID=1891207 RepID=UPI00131CB8FE|nr:LuxR C-terminal-related transcriptional regulator [Thaumasiovibrio subtropicus]
MDNRSNAVLFLGDATIQARLMQQELKKYASFEVKQKSVGELKFISQLNGIDIILLDYAFLDQKVFRDVLMTETLNFDLIIYNVPKETPSEELVAWKRLKGILFSDAPIAHITRSVDAVLKGEMWLPRSCMEKMLSHYRTYTLPTHNPFDDLTRREKQILDRLVCGQTNQEIADELFVAESTVKTHIYKLYKKMNVHCRSEAIRCVRQAKQIERSDSLT